MKLFLFSSSFVSAGTEIQPRCLMLSHQKTSLMAELKTEEISAAPKFNVSHCKILIVQPFSSGFYFTAPFIENLARVPRRQKKDEVRVYKKKNLCAINRQITAKFAAMHISHMPPHVLVHEAPRPPGGKQRQVTHPERGDDDDEEPPAGSFNCLPSVHGMLRFCDHKSQESSLLSLFQN